MKQWRVFRGENDAGSFACITAVLFAALLGAVTIRLIFCATVLRSAAAHFPGKFGLYGYVLQHLQVICVLPASILRVHVPLTMAIIGKP